jgi:predicted small lipoprotein YifL
MKTLLLAAMTVALLLSQAACGKKGDLEPPEKHHNLTQPENSAE